MKDATMEYKERLKRVVPSFDADYYDRLILGEPQTLAPKDLVGLDQLEPIGTLGLQQAPPTSKTSPHRGTSYGLNRSSCPIAS